MVCGVVCCSGVWCGVLLRDDPVVLGRALLNFNVNLKKISNFEKIRKRTRKRMKEK